MCIAKLPALCALVLCGWIFAGPAQAHPVSQGAMTVTIFPGRVELQARVATEEVFVRNAFAAAAHVAPAESLEAAWQGHGRYLLDHVRLVADGKPLPGRLDSVLAPGPDAQGKPGDRLTCRFTFPLPAGRPAAVRVEQDVLNEFDYAPGNRWEATYVVQIGQEGRAPSQGRLLTSREPLEFRCDWGPAATAPGGEQAGWSKWRLIKDYVHHGILHILTGYDHLLFISALALATITFWDLVKVISAFTLAHTVTLTLATLDIVRLPSHVVEPMISASIVFVALQNLLWPRQSRGSSRLAIAFFFGLFHGLGFAGGLLEAMEGLPGVAVFVAIAAFSLGVELGHQAVVLPLFCGLRWARNRQPSVESQAWVARAAMRYGSSVIALAGTYYFVAAVRG